MFTLTRKITNEELTNTSIIRVISDGTNTEEVTIKLSESEQEKAYEDKLNHGYREDIVDILNIRLEDGELNDPSIVKDEDILDILVARYVEAIFEADNGYTEMAESVIDNYFEELYGEKDSDEDGDEDYDN